MHLLLQGVAMLLPFEDLGHSIFQLLFALRGGLGVDSGGIREGSLGSMLQIKTDTALAAAALPPIQCELWPDNRLSRDPAETRFAQANAANC